MINYIGSKYPLSDFILPHCPKNPKYWVESFGGMYGLFFNMNLKDYPDTEFIYNDINPLNSNLFEHLKKDKFINKVISTDVNESVFLESYGKLESKYKEEKALAWLIILCCGELKDLMSKLYHGNSSFQLLKYKLPHYSEYFSRIKVYNLDYKKIFKKYDSEDTFFYIDCPYVGYEHYYLNHNFGGESHLELSNEIKKLKGNWILSYYKFEEMDELYSRYKTISKKHNLGEEYLIFK